MTHIPIRAAAVLLAAAACAPARGEPATCRTLARDDGPLGRSLSAYEFAQAAGIVADGRGGVVVLDGGASRLLAFRPDGSSGWSAGSEGAGPGEFVNGTGLHRRGDTLAVRDLGNHRLVRWTREGREAGTWSLADLRLDGYPGWVGGMGGGAAAILVPPPVPVGGTAGETRTVVLRAMPGQAPDTLAVLPTPGPRMVSVPGGILPVMPPFPAYPSAAVAPDGRLVVARGDRYGVDVFDASGRRVARIAGPRGPVPITEADRAAYRAMLPTPAAARDVAYPAAMPALETVFAGDDGTFVVRTAWRDGSHVRWDRWRTDGSFVGSLLAPVAVSTLVPDGDRLLGLAEDKDDVAWAGVYRVGAAAPACPGPPVEG